jgi:hypothetical protein
MARLADTQGRAIGGDKERFKSRLARKRNRKKHQAIGSSIAPRFHIPEIGRFDRI